jgi:hypothetical protein
MINEVIFYYLREDKNDGYAKNGHPYGVVAFEYANDGKINRAISLCSEADQFNKRIGKQIALARLAVVKENKVNIEFKRYANGIFERDYYAKRVADLHTPYCAEYCVEPTEYELNLLNQLSKLNKFN